MYFFFSNSYMLRAMPVCWRIYSTHIIMNMIVILTRLKMGTFVFWDLQMSPMLLAL